jgi:hypothetical protein
MALTPLGRNVRTFSNSFSVSLISCLTGVTFFVMGALTSASIVHLFTTPLLTTVAAPQVGVLIVAVVVAALLLAVSYSEISKRKYSSLLFSR